MARSDILEMLQLHGILPTPQRLQIAEILLARPQHLSAEQIIDKLRRSGSAVSKATVYNTLNLFGERGLVKEVNVDRRRRFYDSRSGLHHHFFNVDTGELIDIDKSAVRFQHLPELPEGTLGDGVEVLIRVRNARE
jgi:Fur family iron response transcriptional regulator